MVDLNTLKPGTKVWHYEYLNFPRKVDLREVVFLSKIKEHISGNTNAVIEGFERLVCWTDLYLTKEEAIDAMKQQLKNSQRALNELQVGITQATALIAEHESSLTLVAAA
jgi:hypothetical protein